VDCPVCGDANITKALMAPNISTGEKSSIADAEVRAREVAEQTLNTASKMREAVEENCEYVGDDFAEEARAIHYGDAEERGIYGEATETEVENLVEEDIPVSRIPFKKRNLS